jgi:alpha-glucosidase
MARRMQNVERDTPMLLPPDMRDSLPNKAWVVVTIAAMWIGCLTALAADLGWDVVSPDGKLALAVAQKAPEGKNRLYYQVKLDGREVLPDAPMGITLEGDGGEFVSDLTFVKASEGRIDETYSMPVGKKSRHINRANEKTLEFTNRLGRTLEVYVRAYDDGVAWRYGLPGSGVTKLKAEDTGSAFHIPAGSIGWLQQWTENYETGYGKTAPNAADHAAIAFPALFKTAAGVWVMLTEAAVYSDYAGSRVHGALTGSGLYHVEPLGAVNVTLPLITPWRVILLGRGLGAIVESVLVEIVNINSRDGMKIHLPANGGFAVRFAK